MKELAPLSPLSTSTIDQFRTRSTTIEELKKVVALSDLPDDHLQWLLDHSDYHEYEDGTLIGKTGD
jgi:hypothetical protein